MTDRGPEREAEILATQAADRVLERASELEALRKAGTSVAELRAAATEAGISNPAFDAALEELDSEAPDTRRRWRVFAGIIAAVAGTVLVARLLLPGAGAPVRDQAFLLRCLPVGEAAELVRPLMNLPENTVVMAPEHAPRVITIRGTEEQFRQIRALFDRYEGAGGSCPVN